MIKLFTFAFVRGLIILHGFFSKESKVIFYSSQYVFFFKVDQVNSYVFRELHP